MTRILINRETVRAYPSKSPMSKRQQ